MRQRAALFAVALIFTAGCTKKSTLQTWRLLPNAQTLSPPMAVTAVPAGNTPCPEWPGIRIVKRGKTLRVTVASDALANQAAGWLRKWSMQLEAQGCIPAGTSMAFARLVTEAAPLDPARAFTLLHESETLTGYVDLGPENRLQVTGPLLRAGADPAAPLLTSSNVTGQGNQLTVEAKASPDLLGYEVVWYALRPRVRAPGTEVIPLNSESHIDGKVEKTDTPSQEYLEFAPEADLYRLVYKAQLDAQNLSALLVAGRTSAELSAASDEVTKTASCAKVPKGMCVAIPRRIAVNPYLAIQINDADTAVPMNSTVLTAVRSAGEKDPARVLTTLEVWKPWHGVLTRVAFERNSNNVLNLRLLGGEHISWKN